MPALLAVLKKIETKKRPFSDDVPAETKAHWVRPVLVAEIRFASLTRNNKIRKPAVFAGWRTDKKAEDVTATTAMRSKQKRKPLPGSNWNILLKQKISSRKVFDVGGLNVELTNVEKMLWPGITKADLITYYHTVSDVMLPHLAQRPLSLHIKHIAPAVQGFYIKDMEHQQPEWADIFQVKRKHKKPGRRDIIDYLVCNNEATLLYMINLGAIDVNPWTSRTTDHLHPDYIVIDLDPSDNIFSKAVETGLAAKEVFDELKLVTYPKTSGKTGIHVFIPCSGFSFPQCRMVAEDLCRRINLKVPSLTTTEISVSHRRSKVYLDPNQNDEADTVAAVYSVRPFAEPNVSMPLLWKEVKLSLKASDFNISNAAERIRRKGDLFADVLNNSAIVKNNKAIGRLLNG
jgi:bifunctional non-homologous end joining protein LigD